MMISVLLYILCAMVMYPSNLKDPNATRGKLRIIHDFPSDHVEPRNIYIWTPEHYDPDSVYPVLYMHDGQMLFDSTVTWNEQAWEIEETAQRLIDEQKIPACIIVGIANTSDRYSEYFPQKAYQLLSVEEQDELMSSLRYGTPMFYKPICSDDYLKFIVGELKPFIDENYATFRRTEGTLIAGSSMGGLISMYALFEYPGIFGGAACLSTHWTGIFVQNDHIPDAFVSYMSQNSDRIIGKSIYFDYGTKTLDSLYEIHQLKVDALIRENELLPGSAYMSRKFEGAAHDERSWRDRFEIPLTFLLENISSSDKQE